METVEHIDTDRYTYTHFRQEVRLDTTVTCSPYHASGPTKGDAV